MTSALSLLDHRRRVHQMYAGVRDASDPAAGHELWRATRDDLLGHHPESALLSQHREGFTGLTVAGYDPAYRFEVDLDTGADSPAPERIEVPTGTDGVVPFRRVGAVLLDLPGGAQQLDVWWLDTYGGGVFLPFRETDPGDDGYGGGRYVLDTVKGADLGGDVLTAPGRLVVDLNFAYHPSCAYDPQWACPLAPPGNVITGRVPVGERYVGPWAH